MLKFAFFKTDNKYMYVYIIANVVYIDRFCRINDEKISWLINFVIV